MAVELLHMDCMDYMRDLPDNAFDLAIVDPPYGVARFQKSGSVMLNTEKMQTWDEPPERVYFDELFRVSKQQIIWGGNYFDLPPSPHFIFWHKLDIAPSFARGELAWCSHNRPAAYWASAMEKAKVHPCQKPVKLYQWLLDNYAKPGQRILDTHLGSGSSAIAAHYFGVDFVGIELDEDYYKAAKERFERETAQIDIFQVGE